MPALRFLIIGGYAVAAHGHTRATFDVDFLVRHAEREAWLARLVAAGLSLFGEKYTMPSSGFCEIHDASWPSLDLELPDGEGFAPLSPCLTLEKMIHRNRQLRLWFPAGLRSEAERWQGKTIAEFKL